MFSLQRISLKNQLIGVFLLGCALFLIFNFSLYKEYSYSRRSNEAAIHYYERLRAAREILTDLLSMETGVRGYLLTAQPQFLQPYNEAKIWLSDEIASLKVQIKGDDEQTQTDANQIFAQIKQFQALLATEVHYAQHPVKLSALIQNIRQQKIEMDQLRQSFKSFMRSSQADLDSDLDKIKQKQQAFIIMLSAGSASVIGAMLIATLTISSLAHRSRESKHEIQVREERFRAVMDGINDGLYDYDIANNEIYFSPAYKSMLGFSDDEFPNTIDMLNLLVHPEDIEQMWANFRRYQNREIPNYVDYFRMRHKEGGWRWVMSRGIGIWDKHNQLIRIIGTHADITAQKKREEELRELNTDLETFAYIASHDLRSPLVNLKGFAGEMIHSLKVVKPILTRAEDFLSPEENKITRQTFDQDIPEALRFIQRSVDKMDTLTGAVLDLSRIGRREFAIEPIDVNTIVTRCLDNLAYELAQKSVDIQLERLPVIACDAIALEQVLSNLLENAVKYLDSARTGIIHISAETLKDEVVFAIKDNGRGIDQSDRNKVFEIFRRARNAGEERGIGMGLAYVKTTLRKLGGAIWFESRINEGTTFYFRLPIKPLKNQETQEKALNVA